MTIEVESQYHSERYLVRWEIDMGGTSPRDACMSALLVMQDKWSEATCFTVYDKYTKKIVDIDLEWGE